MLGVALHWHAVEGCIDAATLSATVEHTLDEPVFHRPGTATLDGDVARSGDGFHARITLSAAGGAVLAERELDTTAADCSRLDDSLAVVVAMMVDGVRDAAPAPPPTPLRVPPSPPRQTRAHIAGEIEAGVVVAIGLLPDASPGAYVRGSISFGRAWSLGLAGHGFGASNAMDLGSGARIAAWTGELTACGGAFESKRMSLRVCLALGAGFTDATPIALDGASETRLPLVYDGVEVDGATHLAGPLWIHFRLGVWNPLLVPSYFFYALDGTRRDLPSPWLIEPVFSLGLSARFGS